MPERPVSDLVAATAYYRDQLGFAVDWIERGIALAGLSSDQGRIFLAGPAFRSASGGTHPDRDEHA